MKFLLLLTLLFPYTLLQQSSGSSESLVTALSYKCTKAKIPAKKIEESGITPMRAVIPQNKNFQRNVRINDPAGSRDPNSDTLDGREAEIEKAVQQSRTATSDMDGFSYHAKWQNAGQKVIEVLFWEYQVAETANPTNVTKHQFLCGVNIRPGKAADLEGLSLSAPSEVVSVDSLAHKPSKDFQERVVVNRVEYSDGSIWQRSDWNFGEIRVTYQRVLKEPWSPGMCKSL